MSKNEKQLSDKSLVKLSDDELKNIVGGIQVEAPYCCVTKGNPPPECMLLSGNYGPDCKVSQPFSCPRIQTP